MKSLSTLVFGLFSSLLFAQSIENDSKIEILKNVFSDYEIKSIKRQDVFITKVWEKNASIPLNRTTHISFDDSISALAFEIYLSDDSLQYIYMVQEGIGNMIDITEYTKFQGGGERLIQVIFFDTKNKKFLGKGKNFPLSGFSWIPNGYGDLMEINEIESFKKIKGSTHACLLNMIECPDCLGGLHYIFKFNKGKILTSKRIDGCFEDIVEENNKLYINLITNCYEYEYDGMTPRIQKEFLFKW